MVSASYQCVAGPASYPEFLLWDAYGYARSSTAAAAAAVLTFVRASRVAVVVIEGKKGGGDAPAPAAAGCGILGQSRWKGRERLWGWERRLQRQGRT